MKIGIQVISTNGNVCTLFRFWNIPRQVFDNRLRNSYLFFRAIMTLWLHFFFKEYFSFRSIYQNIYRWNDLSGTCLKLIQGGERERQHAHRRIALMSSLLGLGDGVDQPFLFYEMFTILRNKKLQTKPIKVHRHSFVYILLSRFNQF